MIFCETIQERHRPQNCQELFWERIQTKSISKKNIVPWLENYCILWRKLDQYAQKYVGTFFNPGEAHCSAVESLLVYIATYERSRKLKMRPPRAMRVQDVVGSSFGDNPLILRSQQVPTWEKSEVLLCWLIEFERVDQLWHFQALKLITWLYLMDLKRQRSLQMYLLRWPKW